MFERMNSFSAFSGFNVQHFLWLCELHGFGGRHGAEKRNDVEI